MPHDNNKKILAAHSAEYIIEQLDPFVTDRRKERINAVIDARLSSIQLAIECPSDINNACAAMRTCEALGISTIHLISPQGSANAIKQITQGAFYWIDVIYHTSLEAFLTHTHAENLQLTGGAVTATQTLSDVPVDKPLCIIIGNEQRGMSIEAQNACNYLYKIPMFGMSESMNLSVSAAISLYDTSKRKREQLGKTGDLSNEQATRTRAKYYLNSVNRRLIEGILGQN